MQITSFDQPGLHQLLTQLDLAQLDALPFGVIGFDTQGAVVKYNQFEMDATGLKREYALGKHVFDQLAQCMNNFMVAQRYEDAKLNAQDLDEVLDYVLTWRMKPTKVKLRLLSVAGAEVSFIVLSPRTSLNR